MPSPIDGNFSRSHHVDNSRRHPRKPCKTQRQFQKQIIYPKKPEPQRACLKKIPHCIDATKSSSSSHLLLYTMIFVHLTHQAKKVSPESEKLARALSQSKALRC